MVPAHLWTIISYPEGWGSQGGLRVWKEAGAGMGDGPGESRFGGSLTFWPVMEMCPEEAPEGSCGGRWLGSQ